MYIFPMTANMKQKCVERHLGRARVRKDFPWARKASELKGSSRGLQHLSARMRKGLRKDKKELCLTTI